MKLIFEKDVNNEIIVKLQKGTIIDNFSYTEMIRQLLVDHKFEEIQFTNFTDEEKEHVNAMLEKIINVFNENKE